MNRISFLYYVVILELLLFCCKTALSEDIQRYKPVELPKLIVGYSAAISHADPNDDEWKLSKINSKLNSEFVRLSLNIPVRLGFTKLNYIFQADIKGYFSGIKNGSSTVKTGEGVFFVSTPIKELGDKVLLILSSVSPGKVTMMLVDSKLNVELLYDTADPQNTPKDTVCFISSVRVINSTKFEIKEEIMNHCSSVKKGRTFIIDLSSSERFDMYEKP